MPLTTPITTATGEKVSSIHVPKGTPVVVPIQAMGCSKAIWGPDAKEFKPERWLNNREGLTAKAKEIQGYHHILTFVDGPRICLGRVFAFTEMKVSHVVCMEEGRKMKLILVFFNLGGAFCDDTQLQFVSSRWPGH